MFSYNEYVPFRGIFYPAHSSSLECVVYVCMYVCFVCCLYVWMCVLCPCVCASVHHVKDYSILCNPCITIGLPIYHTPVTFLIGDVFVVVVLKDTWPIVCRIHNRCRGVAQTFLEHSRAQLHPLKALAT